MADLITLVLYALAAARSTQLVMSDELLRAPRNWWLAHAPKGTLRNYWITCAWCVSILAGVPAAAGYVYAPHHPVVKLLAVILAFSWLTVLAKHFEVLQRHKIAIYAPQPVTEQEEEVANGPSKPA